MVGGTPARGGYPSRGGLHHPGLDEGVPQPGGYPIQVLMVWGYPPQPGLDGGGYPSQGVPYPGLDGGGTSPPSLDGGGYPGQGGTPSRS